MKTILGYQVHESIPDHTFEQVLVLREEKHHPDGGILDWPMNPGESRSMFPDRKSAKDAITRTNHYRLAFGKEQHPDKKFCRIVPIHLVSPKHV